MTQFLIGCQHFGHEAIIRMTNRPFETVEQMDAHMIKSWNRVVRPSDRVYVLGDFCFKSGAAEQYEAQLNGEIIRVQGNHDRRGWGEHIVELRINRRTIVLCHYPIESWNKWHSGAVHFHAHTHGTEFRTAERRGNVGVEAIGYAPINLETAIERLLL